MTRTVVESTKSTKLGRLGFRRTEVDFQNFDVMVVRHEPRLRTPWRGESRFATYDSAPVTLDDKPSNATAGTDCASDLHVRTFGAGALEGEQASQLCGEESQGNPPRDLGVSEAVSPEADHAKLL